MLGRVHLLRVKHGQLSIFEQLYIEEVLMRGDNRTWYILNYGEVQPRIVMGISGKLEKLVQINLARERNVPIIRRFTGGGTVVTDSGTIYGTIISNKDDAKGSPIYPRDVMKWTEEFYRPVFNKLSRTGENFVLNEHDYCYGNLKFGGNAQSISRDRWVHHTSFLWDYKGENMSLLTIPENRPAYRQDRDHKLFLTKLKDHVGTSLFSSSLYPSPGFEVVPDAIETYLRSFGATEIVPTSLEEVRDFCKMTLQKDLQLRGSHWVTLPALEEKATLIEPSKIMM